MDRTMRTHFGMDERGLGGTYMIQQQFLHMYRRIQSAQKQIDNNPPATSMFRRPTYSRFGDYWKRVQPAELEVSGRVDHHPPASFPLLEDLYINQPEKKVYVPAGGPPQRTKKNKRNQTQRDENEELQQKKFDLLHAAEIEGIDVRDMPETMIKYLSSIHLRREEVAEELKAIRQKRLLRQAADEGTHTASLISTLARDTLRSLDAQNQEMKPVQAEGVETQSTGTSNDNSVSDVLQQHLSGLPLRPPEGHTAVVRRMSSASSQRMNKSLESLPSPRGGPQLHPELLAKAAPKKVSFHRPAGSAPRTRRVSTVIEDDGAVLASPQESSLRRNPQSPTIAPVNSSSSTPTSAGVFFAPVPPPLSRNVVAAVPNVATLGSMAGHVFQPLFAEPHATSPKAANSPSPQKKVIGLISRYEDEDLLSSDNHRGL